MSLLGRRKDINKLRQIALICTLNFIPKANKYSIFVIMNHLFNKPILGILNAQNENDEITHVNDLGAVYNLMCKEYLENTPILKPTDTGFGVALSPQHAIDCLADHLRTSRFLKGIHAALEDVLSTNQSTKIEIVYAGCGPLATLIIPLLHLFDAKRLNITLIDIHESSVENAKHLIKHLNYEDYFKLIVSADATKYVHDYPIDILITETMDKGLTKEPQVAITQSLVPQLQPNGILIPKQISLFHDHSILTDHVPAPKSVTEGLPPTSMSGKTQLFQIDKTIGSELFEFQSEPILKPESFRDAPDICIFTELEVFDSIKIYSNQSYITNPICVIALSEIASLSYRLKYSQLPRPNWSIKK
ncbi:hypothetical protein N9355_01625 [Crocinitomicaceae bacterium]|nr:hypothetical protein [Crocinitomicaceae bacterium]